MQTSKPLVCVTHVALVLTLSYSISHTAEEEKKEEEEEEEKQREGRRGKKLKPSGSSKKMSVDA